MDGLTDGGRDRWRGGWTDGQTVGWMDGRMDRWMGFRETRFPPDRKVTWKMLVRENGWFGVIWGVVWRPLL